MERSANTIDRPSTAAGCRREVGRGGGLETSAFERDCAALDLTDAAQAATRADICRRRGDLTNSHRFERISRELYACADAHRGRTDHVRVG